MAHLRGKTRMSRRTDNEDYSSALGTLTRKQVQDAIRRGNSLVGADIRGVDLNGISFENVDLTRAKLAESNLTQCSFVGANLSHASMWHANLKDACLDKATLEGTDLDFANLDGCTLKGAWVKKAIFPLARISMDEILDAVKSGQRLRMSSPGHD